MKVMRLCLLVCSVVFSLLPCGVVRAEVAPALVISEVKVRNDTAGFDEFIELYNPSLLAANLNDYFISYANSVTPKDETAFTKAVVAQGLLEPGQRLVLAKNPDDSKLQHALKSPFSSLSDSAGTLRLTDQNGTLIDVLAWSSTQSAATGAIQYLPNTTAAKSQSFARDYPDQHWLLGAATPVSNILTPLPEPEPEVDTESSSVPLLITELLPNPASPASDDKDEFIELYNSTTDPVSLKDYKLQSGDTFNYSYTFDDSTLAPLTYQAFYVTQTGNVLSNTKGHVRLLNDSGQVITQTDSYETAPSGEAWALFNDGWQWTTTPTPDTPNVLTIDAPKSTLAKISSTVSKTAASKAPTVKKTATVPKTTGKTTPKKAATNASGGSSTGKPSINLSPLHPAILAGVGTLTLLYAAYEYRHDMVNTIRKLKRYRSLRRATRATVEGA